MWKSKFSDIRSSRPLKRAKQEARSRTSSRTRDQRPTYHPTGRLPELEAAARRLKQVYAHPVAGEWCAEISVS